MRKILKEKKDLILFYIFVTGHWVAGRERFRAGGKIFSPFWELAICGRVWWAEQTGGGWSAVMPDGSYQADIMEDVAIWTGTNFSSCNQTDPHVLWTCKKRCQTGKSHVLCVLSRTFFVTFKIVKKQNHHQTPFLVVNSLCLLGSINPVLFPAESPDYGKHSVGIPILCQSRHQIVFTTLKY